MLYRNKFNTLLFLLMAFACTAQAAKHSHQQEHNVPAECIKPDVIPSLHCSRTPNATFDSQGRLWVAWVQGEHIYVNHSDDQGQSYSAAVVVNVIAEKIAARGENRPKIVVDKQGRVYVSWTQKLPKRFSGHIRFSRSVDGGKHFSDPVTVNDHLEVTSHRFDSLAVNERGDIYVAWLDKRDKLAARASGEKYRGAALYYAISIDGGKHFKVNKKVMDHSCECCRTAMAIDRDGLPVILWRHIFANNIRDHALVKFVSQMKPGKVLRVSHDNWQVDGCPHHGPDISISVDGVYHLVWFNNAPERHGLFYAYSDNQAQTLSKPMNFGNYKANASHPQVLAIGKEVFLAWQEFDGQQSALLVMKSDDGGRRWSPPRRVLETRGNPDHPLLLNDEHTVYVAWHRRGQAYQLIPISK